MCETLFDGKYWFDVNEILTETMRTGEIGFIEGQTVFIECKPEPEPPKQNKLWYQGDKRAQKRNMRNLSR